jgi:hypothetical protein
MTQIDKIGLGLSITVIVGVILLGLVRPYFEMKAFNRCTGGHATYLDAVFTELRVLECKQ